MGHILRVSIVVLITVSITVQFLTAPASAAAGAGDVRMNLKPTMAEAVRAGIRDNLNVLASQFDIEIARAEALTAGLWANPFLFFDTQLVPFGKNWNQSSAGGPVQNDLILSVPIDVSGKRRNARKAAEAAATAADFEFQDFVRGKAAEIKEGYIEYLWGDSRVGESERQVKIFQALVDTLRARIGISGNQPLLQNRARLALERNRQQLERYKLEREVSRRRLATLLGVSSDVILQPQGSLQEFSQAQEENQPLPELGAILADRPDYQALKMREQSSGFQIKAAHAKVWDDVSVGAGVSRQVGLAANPNFTGSQALPTAYSWLASVTVPLPIFSRAQGEIRKATANQQKSETGLKILERTIRDEIAALQSEIAMEKAQQRTFEKVNLPSASGLMDSSQRAFGTGRFSLLEYLDSLAAYQDAYMSYYELLANLSRAQVRLHRALGKKES